MCSTTRRHYSPTLSLWNGRIKKLYNILWNILRSCWKICNFEIFTIIKWTKIPKHANYHNLQVRVRNFIKCWITSSCGCLRSSHFGDKAFLVYPTLGILSFFTSSPYEKVTGTGSFKIFPNFTCFWQFIQNALTCEGNVFLSSPPLSACLIPFGLRICILTQFDILEFCC